MKSALLVCATVVVSILSASSAFALEQIIHPYLSPRSTGMGGVRYTTGLYEENFFSNPARVTANPKWRVTLLDPTVEVNTHFNDAIHTISGGSDFYRNLGDSAGDNVHGRLQTTMPAFYIPAGKWAVGFALITSSQTDIDMRRSYNIDPTGIVDLGPALTVGRKLLAQNALSVGATLHGMYRIATNQAYSFIDLIRGVSLSPRNSGGQGGMIDFDIGLMYEFKHWRPAGVVFNTGFAVNDMLGGRFSNLHFQPIKSNGLPTPSSLPTPQSRSFNFGGSAAKDKIGIMRNTTLAFEVQDIGNNSNGSIFRTFHWGGETHLSIFAVRAGVNQGYLAFGGGIDLKLLTIDASTYGEEMSLNPGGLEDRRYALRVALQI